MIENKITFYILFIINLIGETTKNHLIFIWLESNKWLCSKVKLS